MSYGFSHDTFNIDMVLNFIGRFGEERLYDVKDLLNEQRKQLDIARNIKDINGRSIHRSQLNRFIANTYAPVYIIKPGIVELLAHINEVRNARFEQNEEATRAAIHELARSGDRTITQKLEPAAFAVLLAHIEDERFTPWQICRMWGNGLKAWHIVLMRKRNTHQKLELNDEWQKLKAPSPLHLIYSHDREENNESPQARDTENSRRA